MSNETAAGGLGGKTVHPDDDRADSALGREFADLPGFLLKLVHDLRSPLNASLMWLDVLRLSEQSAETHKAVDGIRRSIDGQSRLLRELGDAAHAAGPMDLSPRRVRIDALTGRIAAAATERSRDCRLTIAAIDGNEVYVDADLDGIARAVGLIVDFFAAGAGGPVQIDIPSPGTERRLFATITRIGATIAADTLRALVQPPWRRPPKAYESKELNFGIFIAARLVTAHGGRLSVVDTPTGAAARLELPLANQSAGRADD